uniref:von Willebrand factor A domain containing 1 n=1 Tax=Junco hyemalis TaxID=40217 RepID=A0A8C5NPE3_JUNHY
WDGITGMGRAQSREMFLPGNTPQPSASNTEGDLLFLLDSSASVSRYEFSKVKEFMWDLLQPLAFGPRDVQASIIHISTSPSMEFPFDRHLSGAGLRSAIAATRQRMGDTNTGKALALAKEKLFSSQAGARPDVPKVLVWVTDGFSTDDISEPMQLLKDMGVTVFIVSTGRGNFLQLSAAASAPSDAHLHFVDVDDLPIITPELRDAIRGTRAPGQQGSEWAQRVGAVTSQSSTALPGMAGTALERFNYHSSLIFISANVKKNPKKKKKTQWSILERHKQALSGAAPLLPSPLQAGLFPACSSEIPNQGSRPGCCCLGWAQPARGDVLGLKWPQSCSGQGLGVLTACFSSAQAILKSLLFFHSFSHSCVYGPCQLMGF